MTIEQYRSLVSEVNRHNNLYYKDAAPEISDTQYDMMMQQLLDAEAHYPEWVSATSPTRRVGNDVINVFEQVNHTVPMLSIENMFTVDDVAKFCAKGIELVAEPKIDGMALSVHYENGVFVRAVTRGDGKVGEDVTHNAVNIMDIPLEINETSNIEVRGEVYMRLSEFEELNSKKITNGEKPLANPRNAGAGAMKRKDSAKSRETPLHFFAYNLITDDPDINISTQTAMLRWLQLVGFSVQDDLVRIPSDEDLIGIANCIDYMDGCRKKLDYPTDGIVFKVNHVTERKKYGDTSKHPKWIAAYKFKAEQATTTVNSVTVQVGKMGVLTPVAELEPVELAGTIVKRASLHNWDMVAALGLCIGDTVSVEKAGEIIPYVIEVDVSCRPDGAVPVKPPVNCPTCNAETYGITGSPFYYCPNEGCPARVKAKIKYFTEKGVMDIDGLGEAIVDQLVRKCLVKTVDDLYLLTEGHISGLERMGEKSAKKIITAIQASKDQPFHRVIAGLQIPNTGRFVSEWLSEKFENIDNLLAATPDQLISIEGVGEVMAKSIIEFLKREDTRVLIENLKTLGLKMEVEKEETTMSSNTLDGKKFCVTGTLENYKRTEIQQMIKDNGGKVASGVSKTLDFLIAGDKAGSKLTKAEDLGVTVISEGDFLQMIGD